MNKPPKMSDDPGTQRGPEADPASAELAHLQRLSRLLDASIRLPGGFRIGWDTIIGLVPGIGDAVGAGLSAYIVWSAARMGAPRHVLTRMIANVGIDTLIGSVPLVGDLFDAGFKANLRNVALLERAMQR